MTSFVILAMKTWAGEWIFDCRLANQILSLRNLRFEDTTLWEWLEWWAYHFGATGHACSPVPTGDRRRQV